MKYLDVLRKLAQMSDEQLLQDVSIFDWDNSCSMKAKCFGVDIIEDITEDMDCEENTIVVVEG